MNMYTLAHGCLPCSIEHSIDALWFTLPPLIAYLRAVWHHRRRHGDCGEAGRTNPQTKEENSWTKQKLSEPACKNKD